MTSKNNYTMAGNAFLIMISVLLSRVLGFFRTMLIPEMLGGMHDVTDAYNLAFLLPDLMFSLLVGGAIAAALIPMLAGYVEADDTAEGWKAVGTFINILFIIMTLVCVLGIVFTPQLMTLIAPGYTSDRETYALAVSLTRTLFPSVCFLMLAGICNGILNSHHKFAVAAFGPCIYNLLCILSIVLLSVDDPSVDYGVRRVTAGVVISSFLYFCFQAIFTITHLKEYRLRLYLKHEGFRKMIKLAIPSLLTTSVMQINIIISNSVATQFAQGGVTALNLANKTWQMPLGIIAQSMGVAMLPVLSSHFATGKMDAYIDKFNKALRLVLLLSIPCAAAFAVLANPIIRTLFRFSDRLSEHDVALTAGILSVYALALVAQSVNTILNRSFFAARDAFTPFFTGFCSIIINIGCALLFYYSTNLGIAGIALAYSLATSVNMIALSALLQKRFGIIREKKRMVKEFLKTAFASACMAVFLYGMHHMLLPLIRWDELFLTSKSIQVIWLGVLTLIGAAVYFVLLFLLQSNELSQLKNLIMRNKQSNTTSH